MGRHQFTQPGRGAQELPHKISPSNLGLPVLRAPTFPPSPPALLSALHAPMALPPSVDYPPLWATAGRA